MYCPQSITYNKAQHSLWQKKNGNPGLETDNQQQNREFLDIYPHNYFKIKANLNSRTKKGLTAKIPQEQEFTIYISKNYTSVNEPLLSLKGVIGFFGEEEEEEEEEEDLKASTFDLQLVLSPLFSSKHFFKMAASLKSSFLVFSVLSLFSSSIFYPTKPNRINKF